MRLWSMAQVLLCIGVGCFIASFVWAGFAPDHPAVLSLSRAAALATALGVLLAIAAFVAARMRAMTTRLISARRGRRVDPAGIAP